MRHQINKFKLSGGKDSNDMLLRKLAYNFLDHGTMITTEKKGKSLSSYMSKLVEKSKEKTEANKNYLLRQMGSVAVVNTFFDKVGPVFKGIQGGYIGLKRLQTRYSDGAMMVKVSWIKPVVLEKPVTPPSTKSNKSKAVDEKDNVVAVSGGESEPSVEVKEKAPKTKKITAKAKVKKTK